MMLPGAAYPSQTKPRNSSRLDILRLAAERKVLYFLPGNFGECNPQAFKINSCSHSLAMLADGPVGRSVRARTSVCTHTHTHTAIPRLPCALEQREPCSKAPRSEHPLPQELLPLGPPCPDFATLRRAAVWVAAPAGRAPRCGGNIKNEQGEGRKDPIVQVEELNYPFFFFFCKPEFFNLLA